MDTPHPLFFFTSRVSGGGADHEVMISASSASTSKPWFSHSAK